MYLGAGTFGTVRLGVYRPKNGEPEVQCALKYLKQADELPNQKVHCNYIAGNEGSLVTMMHIRIYVLYFLVSFNQRLIC